MMAVGWARAWGLWSGCLCVRGASSTVLRNMRQGYMGGSVVVEMEEEVEVLMEVGGRLGGRFGGMGSGVFGRSMVRWIR